MRALSVFTSVYFVIAIGVIAYILGLNSKAEGAKADATEYLMSHTMMGDLPTVCFWRDAQRRYICRVNRRAYLTCQSRGFFQPTLNPNRCTLVDIPETR